MYVEYSFVTNKEVFHMVLELYLACPKTGAATSHTVPDVICWTSMYTLVNINT